MRDAYEKSRGKIQSKKGEIPGRTMGRSFEGKQTSLISVGLGRGRRRLFSQMRFERQEG